MKADIKLKGVSGIYQIKNLCNGKIYIGRTNCFWRRCHSYRSHFKRRDTNGLNSYLMNSMIKHGIENFEFKPVEFCRADITPLREYLWVTNKNSTDSNVGYNLRLDTGVHMITSKSTSEKISRRLKKEWASGKRDGHSKKLKESWKYRDREKMSETFSKTLTKYLYLVYYDDEFLGEYYYNELCKQAFGKGFWKFYRSEDNPIEYKGGYIYREELP